MHFHVTFNFGRLRLEWERGSWRSIRWSGPRWWEVADHGEGWQLDNAKATTLREARGW